MRLREFLKANGAPFKVFYRSEILSIDNTLAREDGCLIKTLLLSADHGYRYIVAVMPVEREINRELASHLLGGALLANPRPDEIRFCRLEGTKSSVSPFGSLCGLLTIVDQSVGQHSQMLFEDKEGELLCFSWQDFMRLENPLIGEFTSSSPPQPSPENVNSPTV